MRARRAGVARGERGRAEERREGKLPLGFGPSAVGCILTRESRLSLGRLPSPSCKPRLTSPSRFSRAYAAPSLPRDTPAKQNHLPFTATCKQRRADKDKPSIRLL